MRITHHVVAASTTLTRAVVDVLLRVAGVPPETRAELHAHLQAGRPAHAAHALRVAAATLDARRQPSAQDTGPLGDPR